MSQPIEVSFGLLPAIEALEREWRDLEERADCSFFTSWSWIGCWLESLPPTVAPRLLRATAGTRTVGLAIFVPRAVRRHQLLSSRALYLHATGDARFDTLTIEANGFLLQQAQADEVARGMIDHLVNDHLQWDEVFLEATSQRPQTSPSDSSAVRVRQLERPTFYIDLQRIRSSDSDHFALLRSKVRYQIRRSIKAYAEHGPVRVRAATDLPQATEFFARMKELHQVHWRSKGLPGAFASAFMCAFHNRLISRCFDRGEVQLLVVEAGERPIGYLYNFVHRGIVSNYQAGIDYDSPAAIHDNPGLAAHFLCARFNANAGYRIYDLMQGDYEFKRRICTDTGTLFWTILQRPRLKFRIEESLRMLRARWRRTTRQTVSATFEGAAPACRSSRRPGGYASPPDAARALKGAGLAADGGQAQGDSPDPLNTPADGSGSGANSGRHIGPPPEAPLQTSALASVVTTSTRTATSLAEGAMHPSLSDVFALAQEPYNSAR